MNRLSKNKEVTQPPLYDIANDLNNGWPDPPLISTPIEGPPPPSAQVVQVLF